MKFNQLLSLLEANNFINGPQYETIMKNAYSVIFDIDAENIKTKVTEYYPPEYMHNYFDLFLIFPYRTGVYRVNQKMHHLKISPQSIKGLNQSDDLERDLEYLKSMQRKLLTDDILKNPNNFIRTRVVISKEEQNTGHADKEWEEVDRGVFFLSTVDLVKQIKTMIDNSDDGGDEELEPEPVVPSPNKKLVPA